FEGAVGVMIEALNQQIVCARNHSAIQRLARALLILRDDARQDRLPEPPRAVIAEMVPCAEKDFYKEARRLVGAGWIRLGRRAKSRNGIIDILDAAALERHACPCYAMLVAARRTLEK